MILTIKNLTHVYDNKVLFDNISLSINKGEHVGIVGLNGAGKTTFMNIISKKVIQDEGEVTWLSGIRWGYLDQHADIDRTKTVMEYLQESFLYLYEKEKEMNEIYEKLAQENDSEVLDSLINKSSKIQDYLLAMDFYDLDSQIKKVANGLGVNNFGYDTPIAKLSGGQRAKLMLSKLLLENLDVMLLDEPTNFLDVAHIEWLKNYLNSYSGTYMVISHDTEFLDGVCSLIISVENSIVKKYPGNYTNYLQQHEIARQQYRDEYERQQREIKRMEEYIAKNKARAATAGMANSRKKMLDRIEVMNKPITMIPAKFDFPYILAVSKDFVVVENLSIGYGEKVIVDNITFRLGSTDRLWIKGANGIGKSTFIKTLMGIIPSMNGKFNFHINARISYIEQDFIFNNPDGNAASYMSYCHPKMSQKEIREQLAKVGIKDNLAIKSITQMSGGEQVRVKLCALMQNQSNLLILDEPTNHLDVMAKDALMQALQNYPGAVILVSHEPFWAEKICNLSYDLEEKILDTIKK